MNGKRPSFSESVEKLILGSRVALEGESDEKGVLVVRGSRLKANKVKCVVRMDRLVHACEGLSIEEREHVESVVLDGLQLEAITPQFVALFPNMVELDVSNNCVRYVHTDVTKLTRLRRLNLYNNHLTALPAAMTMLNELEAIYLRGNVLLPEEFQENTYYAKATQKLLAKLGAHYGPLEERKNARQAAIVVLLGVQRRRPHSMVGRIPRALAMRIAKMIWSSSL